MFIVEAIPTVLIGIFAFFYLTDRPSDARWLTGEEKRWLDGTISGERRHIESQHGIGMWRSFFDPKLLLLSLNYIGIVTASLGLLLFLPQIIKQLGVSNMQVGWVTMIPYIFGAISMVFCGWISDRIGDRRWSLFTTCVISVVGLVFAGMTVGTWWALVGIVIAAIGFYGTKGPFWSMPTMFLAGPAAASPGSTRWAISVGFSGRPSSVGRSS
jgi:ACS family tartrate transporter-like MFS transporter